MLKTIEAVNSAVNNFIWGIPAMVCIIGVGLYLSFRTGFIQIRKFPYSIKNTLGGMYRTCRNRWNGKYCRCSRCDHDWRTRSRFLDVDICPSWNVYQIF